jgi:hypothetical protein
MTHHKDGASAFLDDPFSNENWMMSILHENLSLRESDLGESPFEIIEKALTDNHDAFSGIFARFHAEGYDIKDFTDRILLIIIEVMSKRESIRNTINQII